MLTGITIRNFRGFRDASVDGFSRVNIVVGDNGSGKSSLLEAVYLALSSSAVSAAQLQDMRSGRRETKWTLNDVLRSVSGMRSEPNKPTSIVLKTTSGNDRALTITMGDDKSDSRALQLPADLFENSINPSLPGSNIPQVAAKFQWQHGGATSSQLLDRETSLNSFKHNGSFVPVGAYFIPTSRIHSTGPVGMFSMIDSQGDSGPIRQALREQFPNIESVTVQYIDHEPRLFVKVSEQKIQIPIENHSSGFGRLFEYLLFLVAPPFQCIFIDEIENGLHHTRFPLLWQQIRDFAVRFDKQVFVTTHSQECLEAAAEAMNRNPEDFALLRSGRTPGGLKVGISSGERLKILLQSGLEVRG